MITCATCGGVYLADPVCDECARLSHTVKASLGRAPRNTEEQLFRLHDDLQINHPGCQCGECAPDANVPDHDHDTWCPVYIMWRLNQILQRDS